MTVRPTLLSYEITEDYGTGEGVHECKLNKLTGKKRFNVILRVGTGPNHTLPTLLDPP